MGLDQYAFTTIQQAKAGDAPIHCRGDSDQEDVFYWRKHNRLQGWMEKLYRRKGGTKEFNCVDVELTLEDIDQLETAILNKDLPETGGFFFGNDSYSDYEGKYGYKDDDVKFINKAKEVLNSNKRLYYSSWW